LTAYLLDTNVLSEVVRPTPDHRVTRFLVDELDLWLSVVSLHELSFGASRIADPIRRHRLMMWIESLKFRFRGRMIPVDEVIAESAGRARGYAAMRGFIVGPLDGLIAATALIRSMTLATRNIRDFKNLDVVTFNPWSA
jgi:toxin FitB